MRLLLIHADRFSYHAKKAIKNLAEELTAVPEKDAMEDTLVAFCSVEKGDESNTDGIIENATRSIHEHAQMVKVQRVFVYPYAHLSDELAAPRMASQTLIALAERVKKEGYDVKRAPFGWYKAFELHAKGHPLAELSRTITASGHKPAPKGAGNTAPATAGAQAHESAALASEKRLTSAWYVLTLDGRLVPAAEFQFQDHPDLEILYKHETNKEGRKAGGEPAHVRLMQEMELVDYEPGSDQGNFRWYPKGALVKRLIERHVSEIVGRFGGMRVETPIMYDYQHPALNKYLNRFPARQYILKSEDKEFFLRFAACFGQYLIAHDMVMSYKHLPVRLYELTHYSFRREQSGELSGLRRLRTFTMPDMHTIVADIEQAKSEYLAQYKECAKFMQDVDLPYYPAIRFVRSFYEENEEFARELVRTVGKPALVEIWDDRFFYFVMKFEFNVVDGNGKASALSTVQIDVENCERFGIQYTDNEGQRKTPLILHTSVSGSVDRNMYALLETAARRASKGIKPSLPYWLSPTQVRLVPVSAQFTEHCMKLAKELPARVDVDEREETVGKRIREAEKEWVPIILVVGGEEVSSGVFPARVRGGPEERLSHARLVERLEKLQGAFPSEPLPLPMELSRRPIFRG